MKILKEGLLCLFLLLAASSAKAEEQESIEDRLIEYGKSFSYSVKSSYLKGSTLHIGGGMAVALLPLNGKCILATAKHLIPEGRGKLTVTPLSGYPLPPKEITVEAVYDDAQEDIAFLSFKTNISCAPPHGLPDENKMIERPIIAFKPAQGGDYLYAKGRIIDFRKYRNTGNVMIAEMAIEKGFSGGGAFDYEGNLLGIMSGMDDSKGIAYMVSLPRIAEALHRLKERL